jgi:Ca-activated chloride channel homolog
VVYAGAAGIVLDPTNKATYVKQALDCLSAGGSTAGGQGMELAYATAKANFIKGGINRVIMATDGDFNVGISSNDGIEAIVKKHREEGITLTTLGFGQGNYNEAMMEHVADVGNGNYAYIDSAMEAQKVLDEEMASTIFTIAKDVKIQLEFNPAHVKQYRLIGYENRLLAEEDFDNDKVDAGDIGSGHQVTALYEIVPTNAKGWLPARRYEANRSAQPQSGKPGEMAWLKLRYKLPNGDTSMLIERPIAASTLGNAAPPHGDMAFVSAVAAYGQKLRGDKYLGSYSWSDIRSLAGQQQGYLRGEFIKLTGLAGSQQRQN